SLTGAAQGEITYKPISDTERAALFPSRDMIEFGRTAAEANCAGCHGMDGYSDAEGKPQLAGQRVIYIYRVLKDFQSGARKDQLKNHNAFLNDQAMLSTAVYYASLTPAQIVKNNGLEGSDELSESAEQAAIATDDPFLNIRPKMKKCVKCHGESGEAPGSGMPSLTAQDPEYFVSAMMGYVDGSRSHSLMRRLAGTLDETSLKEMGVYYAVQEPQQSATQGEGDINVGRRLSESCESCHGVDGNAKNPNMPTLAGQDAKYFVKAMNHYKDGTRKNQKMFDAAEPVSEQDMLDLATYYAAQEPRRRDVRSPLKSTEWITRCERCHGIDGNSSDPRFPMLAGQDETYLRNMLKAYANGALENTTMYAMAASLSNMDIRRIAAFFASQQPKAVVYMQLPCGDEQQ
ncbi:MAG: c-type cytochrome, partial [Lysobacterales bacterium]